LEHEKALRDAGYFDMLNRHYCRRTLVKERGDVGKRAGAQTWGRLVLHFSANFEGPTLDKPHQRVENYNDSEEENGPKVRQQRIR
jgi:hypothetical protein